MYCTNVLTNEYKHSLISFQKAYLISLLDKKDFPRNIYLVMCDDIDTFPFEMKDIQFEVIHKWNSEFLNGRLYNSLRRNGMNTIEDALTIDSFAKFKNFGILMFENLIVILESLGFSKSDIAILRENDLCEINPKDAFRTLMRKHLA